VSAEARFEKKKGEALGIAAVSTQTIISIVSFFVAKATLHGIHAGPMLLFRCSGAAVLLCLLLAVVRKREIATPARGDFWRLAGLGVIGVPLNQGLFLGGLGLTTAAHAALLYALTPALVLMIGVWRGVEAMTRPRVIGIVLALAGVALVLGEAAMHAKDTVTAPVTVTVTVPATLPVSDAASAQAPGKNPVLGDLMILGAVVCWAFYTALSRGVVARLGAVRATAGALSIGALVYVPLGLYLARDVELAGIPASAWQGVAWMIVMASVVAYLCWYFAIKRLDPSRVAIFINLQPIGTALGSWLIFGIRLGPAFLVGGTLAVAGVLIAQQPVRRPAPVAPEFT
jgi:drug/metabolite transporter (DMT)-like permease